MFGQAATMISAGSAPVPSTNVVSNLETLAITTAKELISHTETLAQLKIKKRAKPNSEIKIDANLQAANTILHEKVLKVLSEIQQKLQVEDSTEVKSHYLNYFLIILTRYNGLFLTVSAVDGIPENNILLSLNNTQIKHPLLMSSLKTSVQYRHVKVDDEKQQTFRPHYHQETSFSFKTMFRYGYHENIDEFVKMYAKANLKIGADTQATNILQALTPTSVMGVNLTQGQNGYMRPRDESNHKVEQKNFLKAWGNIKNGKSLTDTERDVLAKGRFYRGNMPMRFGAQAESKAFKHFHVGHAAELIHTEAGVVGFDLVNFGIAGPLYPRETSPGISTDCYPMLSVVCISHNHYDHLDTRTLQEALRGMDTLVIAPAGDGNMLKELGLPNVIELASWNDSVDIITTDALGVSKEINIRPIPARHGSGRHGYDINCSLFMGHMLQEKGKDYVTIVTGDTGVLDEEHYDQLEQYLFKNNLTVASACIASGPDRPRQYLECTHQSTADAITLYARLSVMTAKVALKRTHGEYVFAPQLSDLSSVSCKTICYHQGCYRLGVLNYSDVDGTLTRTLAALSYYGELDIDKTLEALSFQKKALEWRKNNPQLNCNGDYKNYYFAIMDNFERVALIQTLTEYKKFYDMLGYDDKKLFTAKTVVNMIATNFYQPEAGRMIDLSEEKSETVGFKFERLIVNRDPSGEKECQYEAFLDGLLKNAEKNKATQQIVLDLLHDRPVSELALVKELLFLYRQKTPYKMSSFFNKSYVNDLLQNLSLRDYISSDGLRKVLIELRGRSVNWQTADDEQRSEGSIETILLMTMGLLDKQITGFDKVFKRDLIARAERLNKADFCWVAEKPSGDLANSLGG